MDTDKSNVMKFYFAICLNSSSNLILDVRLKRASIKRLNVMVWADIMNRRTELLFVNGDMYGRNYVEDVLRPNVHIFA